MTTKPPKDPKAPKKDPKALDNGKAIIARYPAFKGLVNGNAEDMSKLVAEFGQDTIDLLLLVIADGDKKPELRQFDLTTQAGVTAWDAKFAATSYVGRTTATQRTFDLQAGTDKTAKVDVLAGDIANAYGELKLSKGQLSKLATQALRNGYGLGSAALEHLIYSEAYVAPTVDTTGATALDQTSKVAGLRKIAKDYGYETQYLPDQIKSVLTGEPYNGAVWTEDTFINEAKKQAIGHYSHLKDRLDAGSSLEDIFGGYRNRIASVLELDPKSVNLSDSKYARVLGSPETGQMSLADVESLVKTDETYGYQYTKKANRDGLTIAASLGRMFGEVK